MSDHEAFTALPSTHWIHKALAKTKKGGTGKQPAAGGKPVFATKTQMAQAPDDEQC